MKPGEINVDPIEGEFFTTEAIGSVTDALVRESIQNSLDAASPHFINTAKSTLTNFKPLYKFLKQS
jgi:hypothetical protein